ncbi:hypothetical protein, partial [Parachlamydia acanthamoebae]|uniref:hypothetical protein n=1 Tax=Parachlamydia acanthamoebae TaxID=83552 RepID=UPI00057FB468
LVCFVMNYLKDIDRREWDNKNLCASCFLKYLLKGNKDTVFGGPKHVTLNLNFIDFSVGMIKYFICDYNQHRALHI